MTTTHILKPTWSRLLHRMHTLGTIRHKYHNALASISAEGVYPRLLTTPREDQSIAINGNHYYFFENWKQVTVRVVAENSQADFLFTSEAGEIFHEISLTAKSQWDCFECMLKIFEKTSVETLTNTSHHPVIETVSTYTKINSNIAQVAKAVNREIIRGKRVLCSLPLAGTSALKDLEFKSLMTQFGTVALKKQNGKLVINSQVVSHHEIVQRSNKFLTTLFDSNENPLLEIQSA